jgi:hypothetical protein
MMDVIEPFVVRNYLLYFLLPAWIATGALDWWCHRRTGIERFGPYEPLLHLMLLSLAGLPILLGLFLQINALVLLAMILCFLAHEVVGFVDINWATSKRGIPPLEQRVHDLLTAIPFAALSLVLVLHWQELALLVTQPGEALRQPLRLRVPQLAPGIVWTILGLVVVGNLVPYMEELLRAARCRLRTAE